MFIETNGLSQRWMAFFCVQKWECACAFGEDENFKVSVTGNRNGCGWCFSGSLCYSLQRTAGKIAKSPQRFHPHPTRFFPVSELHWCVVKRTCCSQRAAIRGKPGQSRCLGSCGMLCAEARYWASEKGISCEKMGVRLTTCMGDWAVTLLSHKAIQSSARSRGY